MSQLREKYLLYKLNVGRDPDAFAQLYDQYVREVYQFIFFKVNRKEDAEDLASTVFTKAWQYFQGKHATVRNFRAFLYELARNTVIDFYRSRVRQQELFFPEEGKNSILEVLASHDIAEVYMQEGDTQELQEALNHLKEEYKEVIVMRFIEELAVKDIAQVLGKSNVATRVLLHRAMNALRNVMQAESLQNQK